MAQMSQVITSQVLEFDALEASPYPFVWVEFRGIAGEKLHPEALPELTG